MGWRIALWIGLVALAVALLYAVRGILMPFVVAWLIAVLLEPVVRKLRLKGREFVAQSEIVSIITYKLI